MAFVLRSPVLATQLLQAMNDWSLALESGNSRSVDVIYLDLCAFNCVPQRTCDRKLLSKLQLYGVTGNCYIDLIENFLIDRKQRVCVRGSSFRLGQCHQWCASGQRAGSYIIYYFCQ